MKILQGQGVSKGVEHGPIYFCRRSQTLIQPDKADDPRFQGMVESYRKKYTLPA